MGGGGGRVSYLCLTVGGWEWKGEGGEENWNVGSHLDVYTLLLVWVCCLCFCCLFALKLCMPKQPINSEYGFMFAMTLMFVEGHSAMK